MQEGMDILCTIRAAEQASADAKDDVKALQVSYDAFVDDIQVTHLNIFEHQIHLNEVLSFI